MLNLIICFVLSGISTGMAQDFSQYNTSLAIIVGNDFMSNNHENLPQKVNMLIKAAKTSLLKNSDISIDLFDRLDISLKKGYTAVLTLASCEDTWRLFDATSNSPHRDVTLHLAITQADCPRLPFDAAITIPLVTGGYELPQILLDLKTLHAIKWNTAVLLYDASLDENDIHKLLLALSMSMPIHKVDAATVSIYKFRQYEHDWARRQEIYEVLDSIPVEKLGKNFLIVARRDLVGVIMQVAKTLGLVHPLSQWLYIIADTDASYNNISGFSALLGEGENVSFIYNVTNSGPMCKGGLFCHIEELLSNFIISQNTLLKEELSLSSQVSDEEWETIRPSNLERRFSLLSRIKNHITLTGECDKCVAWALKAGETWGREYENQQSTNFLHLEGKKPDDALLNVGVWHPREGYIMEDVLFPHVVHGFRGKTLPLISFNYPPWQMVTYNESGQVTSFKGLIFEIVNELAQSMNFTYVIHFPSISSERHHFLQNRTESSANATYDPSLIVVNWDNIIDTVRQKKVFLGAGAFVVTPERKNIINFTAPIGIEPFTLLVARPKELSRALLFLSPFSGHTWICIIVALAVMGPLLNIFHKVTPYYDYFHTRQDGGLQKMNNCLWYMYGALLQQGGIHLPRADSGRLIVGTWWLFVLVIVTTYSGKLYSFLTFPKIDTSISTLEDLLSRKSTVTWGILARSNLETHLKNYHDRKYQNLYENAELHDKLDSEVLNRVKRGEHVFIDWKTNLLFLMKRDYIASGQCDFALASEEFLEEQIAMIVAQGSPYLLRINEEIRRIHRVGLIYKWLTDSLPKRDKCWSNRNVKEVISHTVNLIDMQGSFFVLFLGFIAATAFIIGEYLYRKWKSAQTGRIIQPFIT